MKNDMLEKALERTWENKKKFYEDTKGLSMVEIIRSVESKYKSWSVGLSKVVRIASAP